MAGFTVRLAPDSNGSFDPATGILQYVNGMNAEMVRIPRGQRLRTTEYGDGFHMYYMAGSKIVLEVIFDPTEYPDMYVGLSTWWMVGRSGSKTAQPEGG